MSTIRLNRHIFVKFGEDNCTYAVKSATYSCPHSPTEGEQELAIDFEGERCETDGGGIERKVGRERGTQEIYL